MDDVLQAVIAMAQAATNIRIFTGSNPSAESIAMTGSGAPAAIYRDMDTSTTLSIVCNGKSSNQKTIVDALDDIHAALTLRKDFPSGPEWQVYAIQTIASPRLIGREENNSNQWIYGSSLLVKIYAKGMT